LIFFSNRPEFLITQVVYFDEDTSRNGGFFRIDTCACVSCAGSTGAGRNPN
jgi:hypothetical protein